MIKKLPLILSFLIILISVSAQNTTDELINKLYQLWDKHYIGYSVNHIEGDKNEAVKLFNTKSDSLDFDTKFLMHDLKMAEADVIGKDWGIDWNTNYLINTAPGMDVADNIIYRSRVQ